MSRLQEDVLVRAVKLADYKLPRECGLILLVSLPLAARSSVDSLMAEYLHMQTRQRAGADSLLIVRFLNRFPPPIFRREDNLL